MNNNRFDDNDEPPPYDDGYGDEGDYEMVGFMDTGAEAYVDGFLDGVESQWRNTKIVGVSLLLAGLGIGGLFGLWLAK